MAKDSKTKVLTSHLEMISAYSNNLMFKHPQIFEKQSNTKVGIFSKHKYTLECRYFILQLL